MGRKKKGKITMSRNENRRVERGVGGRKDAKRRKAEAFIRDYFLPR